MTADLTATYEGEEVTARFSATLTRGFSDEGLDEIDNVQLEGLMIMDIELTGEEIASLPKRLRDAIYKLSDGLEFEIGGW